jgi:ATP-dependent DNA helicase RecG
MPSALETLVKILKLEGEKGYQNQSVTGGLSAFSRHWIQQAHQQARTPEHHALVEEVGNMLARYESTNDAAQRREQVDYMLGRITGRIPMPDTLHPVVERWRAQAGAGDSGRSQSQPSHDRRAGDAPPKPRDQQKRQDRSQHSQQNQPRRDGKGSSPQRTKSQSGGGPRGEHHGNDGGGPEFSSLENMEFSSGRSQLDIPARAPLERPPRAPRPSLSPEEAADLLRGLSASVEVVRGIGPAKVEMLRRLGIETIDDLLTFLPRRYDDYTQTTLISRLETNQTVTVIGTIRAAEVRRSAGGRNDLFLIVEDGSASMGVTFFSQHYLSSTLRPGTAVVLHGRTSTYGNRIQLTNPEWDLLDPDDLKTIGIVPVYPLTEGLNGKSMRRLMHRTVEFWAEQVPDFVPQSVLDRTELADLGWTYRNLHFPETFDHLRHARRRYVFDELLLMQLVILDKRRQWQSSGAYPLSVSDEALDHLIRSLFPYPLTGAQQRVIQDIRHDIARDVPMNRLLQGDVGSGKTAVAITAMALAWINGHQAAIMAPTGILAEQHFKNISAAFERLPAESRPHIALLTSSINAGDRQIVLDGLRDGTIDIVIGTHAVIQQDVEFQDLALAIIDEQHRFGVEQRGALRGKGINPHLLVMTATPIPRTLSLTLYADLDLSLIDEMPPGRTPVKTRRLEPAAVERVHDFVKSRLNEGQQAFFVYPLVDSNENIEAEAATEAFERLSAVYYRYRVGLLHGRMKPAEKDQVMIDFRECRYDVLVTTSVAEVGVDIPNASVIVIHNADRFGLASLHQFRGRVGRGGLESFCFLVSDSEEGVAKDRLKAMEQTNDGFRLAEIDWRLRGPGDLVGTRQSGQPVFKLMDAMSPELVEIAQKEARTLFEEDPELRADEHRLLAQRVQMLRDARADFS